MLHMTLFVLVFLDFSFGITVAVGCCDGRMGYSLDGKTWKKSLTVGFAAIDGGVAYSAPQGLFLAQGATRGQNVTIGASTDGINWKTTPSPFSVYGVGIAYSASQNLFVAGGKGNGPLASSRDGVAWRVSAADLLLEARHVAWSERQQIWVAGGTTHERPPEAARQRQVQGNTILSSRDGVSWTPRAGGELFIVCHCVAFSEQLNMWVAGGFGGPTQITIATSPDAITWTPRGSECFHCFDLL